MSVFGYDAAEGRYTYAGFDDAGHQRVLRGHRVDGAWRFQGASERGPSWRRWQVTLTPTDDGFRLVEEVSDRAGPWRVAVELEYVRRR